MTTTNTQVRLASRPAGKPALDNFRVDHQPVPGLAAGEFLVRVEWLSVDPFMVGRMRDEFNYADRVEIGEVMHGYGAGQVVDSLSDDYPTGTSVYGFFGMQEYAVCTGAEQIRVLDPNVAPISTSLGILGIAGITAYWGLIGVGQPKAGETVVVSAAAGSVGLLVGQIARILGCRVVGIAGTPEKCALLAEKFGFDAAINYRDDVPLTTLLAAAVPEGVDVYFDNVGGEVYDAVLASCNKGARLVICGRLATAHLSDTSLDVGVRDHNAILVKAIRKEGFLAIDWVPRGAEAITDLATWRAQGLIDLPEEHLDGVENAPAAFMRLLDGKNIGKQLVRVFTDTATEGGAA